MQLVTEEIFQHLKWKVGKEYSIRFGRIFGVVRWHVVIDSQLYTDCPLFTINMSSVLFRILPVIGVESARGISVSQGILLIGSY